MAKKKTKKKSAWKCNVHYGIIDPDAEKRQKAANKKMWDTIRKREKQLNTIIVLLRKLLAK